LEILGIGKKLKVIERRTTKRKEKIGNNPRRERKTRS